ncbi:MAG: hypothetical protein CO031_01910 [Candidatus Nealsonbacteria bacterium CG_4_9_14_0_2_um_filter_37_38]|uniref:Uncharacterized protein n=1 Tax=Candidatus Nealsonbacteria bacterium CG_4_10_14_0_8_um_filter_37_14 TaxID=1974684 RepID=A0A2M7R604_9BACT|nr:MAG: hypothetical protein COV63_03465 [Candidatus Nealsonbacteria bacterium CG11_big_fil_rev_8_21_14_0_20_37_68]PIW92075.1 MAG: hypothetical protein COZ89_02080 [Candidatus Nealsonbacteria bacterium CG_4_8_14_3_um_filter_37_23]PIY88898.1 MAG: hypothetical protein COY73_02500 [Candidatus Nealsonbacteria bacterium CG_4_10_14_0_8_um_filter_37_14]PJC51567.1 MAG: hypothetical protein CO031_01910 [Candidatus Nealsonbacteria bacterium CG_4_9_14_0_2_um_filter_37_38]
MAETIVENKRLKCPGIIKEGGLAGKACRRSLLVKHPELGWSIPCDRCSDPRPLLSILRDLIEQGELDEKEVLAAISNQKEKRREEMSKACESAEKNMKDIIRLVKGLLLDNAGSLKEVHYYFTSDLSDGEIDKIDQKNCILATYRPNEKISKRLETEVPFRADYIFEKRITLIASREYLAYLYS